MGYFYGKMNEINIEGILVSSFNVNLNSESYYNFEIYFSTPVKYYSYTELEKYKVNFGLIFNSLGDWKIYREDKNDQFGVWYNNYDDLEEIYPHPSSLSGSMKLRNLIQLINYIKESNFEETQLCCIKIYDEVKELGSREIYEAFSKNLSEILSNDKRKEEVESYYKMAGYNLEDFQLGLKCCYLAPTNYNKNITGTKRFLDKVIRGYFK